MVLLVHDQALAARFDERVVVEDELLAAVLVRLRREAPEGVMVRVDEEEAVVAAVGDEDRAGQRAGSGYDAVRVRLGRLGGRRRRGRGAAAALLDERADERDRGEHGEDDRETDAHVRDTIRAR